MIGDDDLLNTFEAHNADTFKLEIMRNFESTATNTPVYFSIKK